MPSNGTIRTVILVETVMLKFVAKRLSAARVHSALGSWILHYVKDNGYKVQNIKLEAF
jgi:hypothetical protein